MGELTDPPPERRESAGESSDAARNPWMQVYDNLFPAPPRRETSDNNQSSPHAGSHPENTLPSQGNETGHANQHGRNGEQTGNGNEQSPPGPEARGILPPVSLSDQGNNPSDTNPVTPTPGARNEAGSSPTINENMQTAVAAPGARNEAGAGQPSGGNAETPVVAPGARNEAGAGQPSGENVEAPVVAPGTRTDSASGTRTESGETTNGNTETPVPSANDAGTTPVPAGARSEAGSDDANSVSTQTAITSDTGSASPSDTNPARTPGSRSEAGTDPSTPAVESSSSPNEPHAPTANQLSGSLADLLKPNDGSQTVTSKDESSGINGILGQMLNGAPKPTEEPGAPKPSGRHSNAPESGQTTNPTPGILPAGETNQSGNEPKPGDNPQHSLSPEKPPANPSGSDPKPSLGDLVKPPASADPPKENGTQAPNGPGIMPAGPHDRTNPSPSTATLDSLGQADRAPADPVKQAPKQETGPRIEEAVAHPLNGGGVPAGSPPASPGELGQIKTEHKEPADPSGGSPGQQTLWTTARDIFNGARNNPAPSTIGEDGQLVPVVKQHTEGGPSTAPTYPVGTLPGSLPGVVKEEHYAPLPGFNPTQLPSDYPRVPRQETIPSSTDLEHNRPQFLPPIETKVLEPNPGPWLNRLVQTLNEVAPLQPTEKERLPVLQPAPSQGENPSESPRIRDLDRLLDPNRKQENLLNYYNPAPVVPHESHQEPADKAAPPPTVAKLEMAAVPPQDAGKSQPSKADVQATVESKIQNLISLLAELKPIRSADTVSDANRVQQAAPVQAGSPNPVNPVARTEQSVLPNLISRISDISVDLRQSAPEQARNVIDPNNPVMVFARQQILAEAISLKDMLNGPGRLTEPMRLSDLTGPNGLRIDPLTGKVIIDPMFPGRGPLDPQGKLDPMAIGKGLEGKIDPLTGLRVLDPLDGTKGGVRAPGDFLPVDKTLTGDRKDVIEKKDEKDGEEDSDELVDKELVTLLTATNKVKDNKPEDKEETTTKDEKKDEQEARRKYIVRQGDTLESIAEKMIGDKRFSLLLEIINRGYIRYKWEGSVKKELLRVGQVLWLPTKNEVKVHMTLFFSRKEKQNAKLQEEAIAAKSLPAEDPETINIEDVLPNVEFFNEDSIVSANGTATDTKLADLPSADRTVVSKERDTKKPADKPAAVPDRKNAAVPSAAPADRVDQSWAEIQDLLNRIRSAAEAKRFPEESIGPKTSAMELPLVGETSYNELLKQLDSRNRIVMETLDEEGAFILRHEKQIDGDWKAIAFYEFRDGRSVRYLNKANGGRRAFYINLPESIVREMAIKDFSKNWKTYARDF